MNGKFPDLSQSFHSLVPMLHPEEWLRITLPAHQPLSRGAPTQSWARKLNLKASVQRRQKGKKRWGKAKGRDPIDTRQNTAEEILKNEQDGQTIISEQWTCEYQASRGLAWSVKRRWNRLACPLTQWAAGPPIAPVLPQPWQRRPGTEASRAPFWTLRWIEWCPLVKPKPSSNSRTTNQAATPQCSLIPQETEKDVVQAPEWGHCVKAGV